MESLECGITSNISVKSLPILQSDLVRPHPGPAGRPAAHPTATGWDEELRARTAGVPVTTTAAGPSFKTDPSVCPIMLRHRYQKGTECLADLNWCGMDARPNFRRKN